MKYSLIYVFDNTSGEYNPYSLLPGQMFEYERNIDTLEEANKKAKAFNAAGGHVIIVPYYEVES